MPPLFNRSVELNAGGLLIRSEINEQGDLQPLLRVTFKVTRTLAKDPNKTEIQIYNLSKDNRSALQEKDLAVTLSAGYIDSVSQIFSGQIDFANSRLNGRDWITALQFSDSGKAYKTSRINTSLAGPISVGQVLRQAGEALGVNLGNLAEKVNKGAIRGTLQEFANGKILSGKAEQQFDKITKALGYSWSIQDNQLQLLEPVETIGTEAIVLSPQTGLVGSPESGEKGFIRAKSLLQPTLLPGKQVQIQSRNDQVNGFYRIQKVVFTGDTWGKDWFADIEGKPLA